MPLTFEPNVGQAPGTSEFLAHSGELQINLSGDGLQIQLRAEQNSSELKVGLLGAKQHPQMDPSEKTGGESNYLLGTDPALWKTHIPQYGKLRYNEIYPGVDLVFYGNGGRLEHDFIVQPGSNYRAIRMRYQGADTIRLSDKGDLTVAVGNSTVLMQAPYIYQEREGRRIVRTGRFLLHGNDVSFAVDGYDPSLPLIIDPVLDYATYLADQDLHINGVTVDAAGNSYIVGLAFHDTYPVTGGALQTTCAACASNKPDVVITKLNPAGTAQVYSTFLGGSNYNEGDGIAVDANGNAIVVGRTSSSDFPLKNPVASGSPFPMYDGFVSSIAPDGASLNFSSRIGGGQQNPNTYLIAVTTDASGNVYVSGTTDSPSIPQTAGALNAGTPSYGNNSIFLTKLQPSGNVAYGAILGPAGSASECCSVVGVAVDAAGNAYIAGSVGQGGTTPWPTTSGAYQTQFITPGEAAPFAAKVSPDGSTLLYSTLVTTGVASSMALTSTQEMILVGTPFSGYPTTADAFDTTPSQSFMAKLSADGTQLLYSSFFGTQQQGQADGKVYLTNVTLDGAGDVWLAGDEGDSGNVPQVHPLQSLSGSPGPQPGTAFVSEFDPQIHTVLFSTYFNGTQSGSIAGGLAVDSQGRAHLVGTGMDDLPTTSSAFLGSVTPPPSGYVYQYGFAALIDPTAPGPGICFSGAISSFAPVGSSTQGSLTVTDCGTAPLAISAIQISGPGFALPSPDTCVTTLVRGAACSLSLTFAPSLANIAYGSITFTSNAMVAQSVLPIYGDGVPGSGPAVTLSAASADFGVVPVGTTSNQQAINVMNVGNATLTVTSIATSGDFTETNGCSSGVLPNEACTVYVTFAPTAAGARTGTLTITSNAQGSPQVVPLTGAGQSMLSVVPGTPTLTVASAGGSVTTAIQLSGLNGFSGTTSLSCTVQFLGQGSPNVPPTCSFSPAQVQVSNGGTVTSTLTISTTAAASAVRKAGLYWGCAAILLMGTLSRRRWRGAYLMVLIGFITAAIMLGCGGGSTTSSTTPATSGGTTTGSYHVMVAATSGKVVSSTSLALDVQ